MNGSPVAGLIRGWVDLYTRGLPGELRAVRRDEIDDDVWCHLEEGAATGRSARSLHAEMGLRLLLGMPADVGWRLTCQRQVSADTLNRRSSMNTRAIGAVALVAGLSWSVMLIAFVAIGDSIWRGSLGGLTILASLVGGIGFPFVAISLATQLQDRLGAVSAVGAVMLVIGALAAVAGTGNWIVILLLPAGSAILLWDISGTGAVSRLVPIAQAATAVALTVAGAMGMALNGDSTPRAATALIFAPFVLSWVALGVSLVRRIQQPTSAGSGSTA